MRLAWIQYNFALTPVFCNAFCEECPVVVVVLVAGAITQDKFADIFMSGHIRELPNIALSTE